MGSCLWDVSRMQVLLAKFDVYRHSFSMACFGGETQKQTWLWSSHSFISGIDKFGTPPERKQTKLDLVEVWTTGGKRKFRGNDQTKSSQTYPTQFGEAVAKLYDKHDTDLKADAHRWHGRVANDLVISDRAAVVTAVVSQARGGWADAELEVVFRHLEL